MLRRKFRHIPLIIDYERQNVAGDSSLEAELLSDPVNRAKLQEANRLDLAEGRVTPVSATTVAFDDDDPVLAMDLTDGNFVLMGQQTVAAISADGTSLYRTHYPAPRDPAWLRGLAWAAGIRAGMASAYAGLYSAAAASAASNSAKCRRCLGCVE